MKRLSLLLLLAAGAAHAEIYRCETEQGPVFSDRPCAADAQTVTVQDSSAGISDGPSDEERAYLAQKRDERAAERAQRQQEAVQSSPAPQPYTIDSYDEGYPYWWNRPVPPRPRPPRPRPPDPDQPDTLPSLPDVPGSGSVLRPGRRGG